MDLKLRIYRTQREKSTSSLTSNKSFLKHPIRSSEGFILFSDALCCAASVHLEQFFSPSKKCQDLFFNLSMIFF